MTCALGRALLGILFCASVATAIDAQSRPAARPKLATGTVQVRVQTELGDIVIEVDPTRAPITSANFLKYVDAGHYDGGMWHGTIQSTGGTVPQPPTGPKNLRFVQ